MRQNVETGKAEEKAINWHKAVGQYVAGCSCIQTLQPQRQARRYPQAVEPVLFAAIVH
jgi:hypothetical protein